MLDRVRASTPRGQTASAGVARWDGEEPAELLLARAQDALAAAKSAGRNVTIAGRLAERRAAPRGRRRRAASASSVQCHGDAVLDLEGRAVVVLDRVDVEAHRDDAVGRLERRRRPRRCRAR